MIKCFPLSMALMILFGCIVMAAGDKQDTYSGDSEGLLKTIKRPVVTNDWLAPEKKLPSVSSETDEFLRTFDARLRLLKCKYRESTLVESRSYVNGSVADGESVWESNVTTSKVVQDKDALDLQVDFKLKSGIEDSCGVAVAFDFNDWSKDNYVMIPAVVYDGNRCKIATDRGYNMGLERKFLYKKDIPRMVCPTPHLSLEDGVPSRLEVTSCNASTPAVCIYDRNRKQAFILLAEQGMPVASGVIDTETN